MESVGYRKRLCTESVGRYDESYRLRHFEIAAAERGSRVGPVQVHASTLSDRRNRWPVSWSAGHPSAALAKGEAFGALVTDKGIPR